jgi:L-threonylcarbamoyladenylate synthase
VDAIDEAVAVLRAGGLVGIPTETVYGLAADAENDVAVARIFAAKGRPADHPLIVHVAGVEALEAWACSVPAGARLLAARFWPGPLTLILPRSARAHDAVTGGQATVGLRVPAHPLTLALLRRFGGGLAAPSANRFGAVSPTTAEHVREDLGARVDLVLDGGACSVGVESTIVDFSSGAARILRPGGVSREAIEGVLGAPVEVRGPDVVRTSGQHASHYAPRAVVRLSSAQELAERARSERAAGRRVGVLAPGAAALAHEVHLARELPEDPAELARTLYQALRDFDAAGVEVLLTTLPPEQGLGLAIADRLRKAAGPRDHT